MKCGRFVRLTRKILSKTAEVLMDIPSNYYANRPTQNKSTEPTMKSALVSPVPFVEFISPSSDEGDKKERWQQKKIQKDFNCN